MADYAFRTIGDRLEIQRLWEQGYSPKEIAGTVGKSLDVVYTELSRGRDGTRLPDQRLRYSAELAQRNVLAVVVAMAVTLVSFFAACQIMGWAVTWYMVAGAVALGLFVSYAAMFGFDKLREALEQITNWGKDKTE